jgi:hypothetical protein
MKTTRASTIIGAVALSFASAISSFAIEGIHLSVQSSNVILSWQSTNTGESYIIQYRQTLNAADPSPSGIGSINPAASINVYDLQKAMGNFLNTAKPQNFHPYRLVFIDGCSTGKGNFCEVFGIPAQTVNNQFFANNGVESRAFLGFKSPKNFSPTQWTWYALMIGGFYADWQSGQNTVQQCVANAVNGVHNSGEVTMDSSWVIYGAPDLQINTVARP